MSRTPYLAFAAGAALTLLSTAASAQAYGSFAATCTRIQQRGPYLQALCQDVRGRLVRTGINAAACPSGIANINGNLACERGYSRRGSSRRGWDDDDDYPRSRSPRGFYGSPF